MTTKFWLPSGVEHVSFPENVVSEVHVRFVSAAPPTVAELPEVKPVPVNVSVLLMPDVPETLVILGFT